MTRRNSWIRRIIAVGLAAGMVMSTTLPALAERAEGYESSVEAENNFADGDSAASVMQSDSQSKAIAEEVQQETQPEFPFFRADSRNACYFCENF